MRNSSSSMTPLFRRANDAFLAPFIVGPNLGFAAWNAAVGSTARIGEVAARAAGRAGVPLAGVAEDFSRRVADGSLSAAERSVRLATDAVQKAAGGGSERTSSNLLARTLFDQGGRTASIPLVVTFDAVAAALDDEPFRTQAWEAWLAFSRWLDLFSIQGVIPNPLGAETDAETRFGFYFMAVEGPLGAVATDIRGIVGGFLALGLGDFQWLGGKDGLPHYRIDMEYVYDKKLHGDVQPETDFPIGATLAADAAATIQRFPWAFLRALQGGDPLRVLRASIEDFGLITTLLVRFPRVELNVVLDVMVFVAQALFQTGDTQSYAICELAIMESTLSDAEKDEALKTLRETANYDTVEFEFYVPLLVPFGGSPEDRAERRDAGGRVIPDNAVAPSVFAESAIERAQALNSKLFSLRSFLWLYRDEDVARQKNRQQTIMKFGPVAAERIERSSLYPTTPEQVATLTQGGPRPPQEVNAIFVDLLRRRGLVQVSDAVARHLPGGLPAGFAAPS